MELKITEVRFKKPTGIGPVGARQTQETLIRAGERVTLSEYRSGVVAFTLGEDGGQLFPWAAIESCVVELEGPKKK